MSLPVNVYLCSASGNRAAARSEAARLEAEGFRVLSTWHAIPPYDRSSEHRLDANTQGVIAAGCLGEIERADIVLVLGHAEMRGALVEVGWALAREKRVIWIGDRSVSLFSALCEVAGG